MAQQRSSRRRMDARSSSPDSATDEKQPLLREPHAEPLTSPNSERDASFLSRNSALLVVHLNIVFYALLFWMSRPVLPFLTKQYDVDAIQFGYLQTFMSLVQLVGGPLMGRLIDTRSAKLALLISHAAGAASYTLLGLAHSVPTIFASQLPNMFLHAMHAAQAAVSELSASDPKARSAALGRLSISYGIGFVLGPTIGGTLSTVWSYQSVALAAGAGSLCVVAITWALLPAADAQAPPPRSDSAKSAKLDGEASRGFKVLGLDVTAISNTLRRPGVAQLIMIKTLVGLGVAAFRANFSLAMSQQIGLDAQQVGFVMSYFGLASMVVNGFLVGWITALLNEVTVLRAACATVALSFALLSQATSITAIMVVLFPFAVGSATMGTVVTSKLTLLMPPKLTGTVIGLDMAVHSACGLVAPAFAGHVFAAYGLAGVAVLGAGFALIALMTALVILRDDTLSPAAADAAKVGDRDSLSS